MRAAHGAGVAAGDVAGQAQGGGQQVGVGDDVVDQAQPVGLRGFDEVAGQAHLPGLPEADGLGQEPGEAASGVEADPGVGVAEDGPFGGEEERALEGQFQSTGHGRAVDGADDRGGHVVEHPPGRALGAHHLVRREA